MNTDRRIYFTTAIVALVIMLAISFLARSDPVATLGSTVNAGGQGIGVREARSTPAATVEAIGVRAPSSWPDFDRAPAPSDAMRLARANPAL
jgi:hypothetical protein